MTLHVHVLAGCTPSPLAHYLKALGCLRLVAEQRDPEARGFFREDAFHLATRLDAAALRRFFLDEYEPTPLVAPWNGGSGFYPKDTKDGIDAIRTSSAPRFAPYRTAIDTATAIVGSRRESPKEVEKAELQARCRAALGDRALSWMSSAVVIAASLSKRDRPAYPALLGTGGNDGRLDFTNNAMQRLVELIDPASGRGRRGAAALLDAALWAIADRGLVRRAIGQFLPGAAGGANATTGFDDDALVNPWDFVLALEGALVLSVATSRALESQGTVQAAAPFAVRASAAGHATATAADESARGEQWMPIWSRPATAHEVRALFAEARLRLGRDAAQKPIDAARAIARLGVARGVDAFERYGYVERNGQANLAVPFGRWLVSPRPHARLVDEIEPWLAKLRRLERAPASLQRAARTIESAALDVLREETSGRWQRLLVEIGEAEALLAERPRLAPQVGPIPSLSPEWLDCLGDSLDVRLAAAIASQRVPPKEAKVGALLGPVRAHLLPLRAPRFDALATSASGLLRDPRVVWTGRDLVSDLVAVATRRMVDASGSATSYFPLWGERPADLEDVQDFLAGRCDDRVVGALARPLMAVRWADARACADSASDPLPAYSLFRLLYAPEPVGDFDPPLDAVPLRLLAAGRSDDAVVRALARLRARGARPRARRMFLDANAARRIAASIAIPISRSAYRRCLAAIAKPDSQGDRS